MKSFVARNRGWLLVVALGGGWTLGCGEDDDTASVTAGAGGGGEGGGSGGEPCGAVPTSDDPKFAELIAFTEAWRKEQGVDGLSLGVLEVGSAPQIANFGVREPGTCDPVTDKTLYRDYLATALATNLGTMVAIDDDLFAPADSANVYATEFEADPLSPHGITADVTVLSLLHETSGMPGGFFSEIGGIAGSACVGDGSLASYLESESSFTLYYPPGSHWTRSDPSRVLLGRVLEGAAGMPYRDAVKTLVFDPLGIEDAIWDPDELATRELIGGAPLAACLAEEAAHGLFISMENHLRLLEVLATKALVSEETWDAVFGMPRPTGSPLTPPDAYYGEAISLAGGTVLIPADCAFVVPGQFVVRMLTWADVGFAQAPCEKALELYTGMTLPAYREATPPSTWSEYTGEYLDPVNDRPVTISLGGSGELVVTFNGSSVEIAPSTVFSYLSDSALHLSHEPDVFFLEPTGNPVRFWRDASGQPAAIGDFWGHIGPHYFRQP